jgi:tetratricopeptide (TPR) repeat protein
VLYAAFLEAASMESLLILVPGHILTAVSTGVPAQAWSKVSVDIDDVIMHRGRTFVPIETTKVGSSFADAWREGAQLVTKSKREAIEFEIIDVREAWRDYPVTAFRTVGTVGYKPSLANVGVEIETLISTRTKNFEKTISAKNVATLGASELSTHAMLLSVYGRTQEARDILVSGVAKYPRDAALTNNLANVELAKNEVDGAIALYNNAVALAADPDGAVRIHLNTAIAARMKGDHALSLQKISTALDRATTESAQRIVQDFLSSIGGSATVRASEGAAFDKRAVAAMVRAALEKRGAVRADQAGKVSLADILYWLEPSTGRMNNK